MFVLFLMVLLFLFLFLVGEEAPSKELSMSIQLGGVIIVFLGWSLLFFDVVDDVNNGSNNDDDDDRPLTHTLTDFFLSSRRYGGS